MLDTHLEVKLKKQLQGEIPILCAYENEGRGYLRRYCS